MKKNVFIIGLGRFGQRLSLLLREEGFYVTVSDINEEIVKSFSTSNNFDNELILNSTNLETLRSTSVALCDCVVVAISKIEDSILTCVNLKDLGIKNIIAKVQNKTHARVLKSIGVTNIIFPEEEAAQLTASKIINENLDIIKKGTYNTILKLKVTNENVIGRMTTEFNDENFFIFGLVRNEANSIMINNPNVQLKKLDTIFILVENSKIKWVRKTFIDSSTNDSGGGTRNSLFKSVRRRKKSA